MTYAWVSIARLNGRQYIWGDGSVFRNCRVSTERGWTDTCDDIRAQYMLIQTKIAHVIDRSCDPDAVRFGRARSSESSGCIFLIKFSVVVCVFHLIIDLHRCRCDAGCPFHTRNFGTPSRDQARRCVSLRSFGARRNRSSVSVLQNTEYVHWGICFRCSHRAIFAFGGICRCWAPRYLVRNFAKKADLTAQVSSLDICLSNKQCNDRKKNIQQASFWV